MDNFVYFHRFAFYNNSDSQPTSAVLYQLSFVLGSKQIRWIQDDLCLTYPKLSCLSQVAVRRWDAFSEMLATLTNNFSVDIVVISLTFPAYHIDTSLVGSYTSNMIKELFVYLLQRFLLTRSKPTATLWVRQEKISWMGVEKFLSTCGRDEHK